MRHNQNFCTLLLEPQDVVNEFSILITETLTTTVIVGPTVFPNDSLGSSGAPMTIPLAKRIWEPALLLQVLS